MKSLLIIVLCYFSGQCYAVIPTDTIATPQKDNSDRHIYVLDSKIVNKQYIMEHLDYIQCVARFETVREAILLSGGAYREPAIICRTKNEKKK